MIIQITYQIKTAYGFWDEKVYYAHSFDEAERVCKQIESMPDDYKLIDVSRIE